MTDSIYVELNMRIMTRMRKQPLNEPDKREESIPCLLSVGLPPAPGKKDLAWLCNPKNTTIAHFLEEETLWSYDNGYGGHAQLGEKCFPCADPQSGQGKAGGWRNIGSCWGKLRLMGRRNISPAPFPVLAAKRTWPGWSRQFTAGKQKTFWVFIF
jgi:hypothetical protein